ncbi:diguanylate cyclase (GGDEF) domain-containing protein [Marinobacter sp. es.042]|uniref:GGDEF domain-containing protein n=1 Tax=Marinobacter sp. es.042 TaxID=1761794 RepID=UPI000B510E53|nr:GGDEF domain-containing protein [Marinobacter sp. es.042]SNB57446.1 diguanylate cyclase (GGDEF) domain-containing protein [Marinobacter sp. es.042]
MAQMAEKFLLSKLSRAGFVALIAIATLCAVLGEPMVAAAAAAAAGIVIASKTFHPNRVHQPWPSVQQAFFAMLLLILLASFWTGPWILSHWLYALPLVAFALVPPAAAAVVTLVIAVLAMIATQWAVGLADRHQMISAFLLTLLLSALLVFLRDYKARQLAPLRRTDELTQAASREYLSADLHKEIQRSEREGTDMSIIMIGLDTHLSDDEPDEDIRSILPRIGRYLHSQIRDFDTYYRVADLQFLVILPGISTSDAIARAETIRKGLATLLESHGMNLTVSTGIAGLNIGDDANSLQQSAANALRRAQQQGGNRSQAYSSWSQPAQPSQPRAEGPVA